MTGQEESPIRKFWENLYISCAVLICAIAPGFFAIGGSSIVASTGTILCIGWLIALAALLFAAPILLISFPGFLSGLRTASHS